MFNNQVSTFIYIYIYNIDYLYIDIIINTFIEFTLSRHPLVLISSLQLIFLGQLFNMGVYRAIGEAGVYYGCRLGETVPWVYGFPFRLVYIYSK